MLKSGVLATLTGVILAMFSPLRSKVHADFSPLKSLEHDLHSIVTFFVLPVFAFANAGVNFSGGGTEQLFHSVPLGIALGLFIGKQVGIFGLCWVAIQIKFARLPTGMTLGSLYGTAALCGIGFFWGFYRRAKRGK